MMHEVFCMHAGLRDTCLSAWSQVGILLHHSGHWLSFSSHLSPFSSCTHHSPSERERVGAGLSRTWRSLPWLLILSDFSSADKPAPSTELLWTLGLHYLPLVLNQRLLFRVCRWQLAALSCDQAASCKHFTLSSPPYSSSWGPLGVEPCVKWFSQRQEKSPREVPKNLGTDGHPCSPSLDGHGIGVDCRVVGTNLYSLLPRLSPGSPCD